MPAFVRELVLRDVAMLTPRTPLLEAARQMARTRHGLLVVVDGERVFGLVTLRQLVAGAEAAAQGHPVRGIGDLVSSRFIFTREDEPLRELAPRMVRAGVRRAVVLDEAGQVVAGVVTTLELARAARHRWRRLHAVDLSSEGSFPASDPPSWTGTLAG